MEFYWHIVKWDGETIKVKPENVPFVQQMLDKGEGFIKTPNRSISIKDIKDFVQSSERYTDQKLLEDASRAFGEPEMNGESIVCKWVKKAVTRREWEKYYLPSGYKLLEQADNHIMVAFRVPVHQIDYQRVVECSPTETLRLGG